MSETGAIAPPLAPRPGMAADLPGSRPLSGRPCTLLGAARMSRWVRDRLGAGAQAVVNGVQRRACQVTVNGDSLLMLSTPEVPLAPNGLAVDVAPAPTLRDAGFRTGQLIVLAASAIPHGQADWLVTWGTAAIWEPRPRVHPIDWRELAERVRATEAAVTADGEAESLLPLLWEAQWDGGGPSSPVARAARGPVRLLSEALIEGDEGSMIRAARGLAGLGPGLTPSGDDALAGFAAAWILVGDA